MGPKMKFQRLLPRAFLAFLEINFLERSFLKLVSVIILGYLPFITLGYLPKLNWGLGLVPGAHF